MQQDFKQNYIDEQKNIEAARKARMAKIGMSTGDNKTGEGGVNASQSRQPSGYRRAVNETRVPRKTSDAQNARAVRTPASVQSGTVRQGVNPTDQTRVPQNRTGAGVQSRQTQHNINRAPQPPRQRTGAAAKQMPASGMPRRTGQTAGQVKESPVSRQVRPAPRKNELDITDSDIFNNSLSENESRAMMFALTGEAKAPDDGGNVDVIDMGFRRGNSSKNFRSTLSTKKRSSAATYVGRTFACIGTALAMVVVTVYTLLLLIAYGPSETVRDLAVNSADQASATKWVPYLVLPKSRVQAILSKSEEVVQDIVSIDDYGDSAVKDEDEWEKAVDGMIFDTVRASTFKAYVLLVKDPTRVFVGTSTDDFSNSTAGVNVFQAADRYGALACINGGEFLDNGGHGSGYAPLGLTYSNGKCVFDDHSTRTFMGFTADNKLIVRESMTQAEADELGIRDAVSFQTGNTLIERDGDDIKFYYADGNTGTSQRTAIGQRADGTVILIVTDGRTASSLGATHNDMIDLMVSYGAVSAGMLDGGSSAMMFYRDYYNKYNIDTSTLDEYQKQGLVNNYKAFTSPRRIPTFFMVKPEA